jgi:hypothetical protein
MSEKTAEPFAAVNSARSLSKGNEDPAFKAVQDFLERFGYLRPNAYRTNVLDEPTVEALTRYQQRQGLATTGVFDDPTREQMTTHRCGMPDLDSGTEFVTRCSWPTTSITFAFEDGTNDIGGSVEFQAVRKAFATWAAATPFTFTEVTLAEHPDVVIDWRPAADPDHSMVGGILAHADFPPGCGVITNALPKPLHFDDSEHMWVVGAVTNGFDVETVALHEIGHILGLQHSDVAGSVMFPTVSSNATKRSLTADDLGGIHELYPVSVPPSGTYTVRQKSGGRFLDAHEIVEKDFRLVTRPAQNNDSQRWQLTLVGTVFAVRQKSNGRYLDAHESSSKDFRMVTRPDQGDASQRWVVVPEGDGSASIHQLNTARFVDAHEIVEKDFALVTRPAQNNNTQRWILGAAGANTFTIRQKSNGRFVDAHEIESKDFSVVTRTAQNNDSQRWILAPVGAVYTVRQKSNGRFVDAHETAAEDFKLVTRPPQGNDSQRWALLPAGGGSFTVRQLSNGRVMDTHDSAAQDFSVVTRPPQNDDTQHWIFDPV